jgi:hypothetical protein
MLDWISNNREWIFARIGVSAFLTIVAWVRKFLARPHQLAGGKGGDAAIIMGKGKGITYFTPDPKLAIILI